MSVEEGPKPIDQQPESPKVEIPAKPRTDDSEGLAYRDLERKQAAAKKRDEVKIAEIRSSLDLETAIELQPIEEFVFKDRGFLTSRDSFSATQATQRISNGLLRPMFIGEHGKKMAESVDESALDVSSTIAMGKAACIEYPTSIGGNNYNFVQWKGVGKNRVNEGAQKKSKLRVAQLNSLWAKKVPCPSLLRRLTENC